MTRDKIPKKGSDTDVFQFENEELKSIPDWELFGFENAEEYIEYKEFQSLMKGEEFDNYHSNIDDY